MCSCATCSTFSSCCSSRGSGPHRSSIRSSTAAQKLHHGWDKVLYFANPLLGVILTFQRVLYNQLDYVTNGTKVPVLPHWSVGFFGIMLSITLAAAVIFLFFSLWVFGKLEGSIAEEL